MSRHRRRRGFSYAFALGLVIALAVSGRFAWLKFSSDAWIEVTEPALRGARRTLSEALTSATYPVFTHGGSAVVARSEDRGVTLLARPIDEGDDVVGSVYGGPRQRDAARFLACSPIGADSCRVTLHRLFIDNASPFGARDLFVGSLYLERRSVEIRFTDLPRLDERLAAAEVETERLVKSVDRVRFRAPRSRLHGVSPHLEVEILCLEPRDGGATRTETFAVDLQVSCRFVEPHD